jgi:diacylglycerol O-acyltransferase
VDPVTAAGLDRLSPDDLVSLVGDSVVAPLQVGAVVVLGEGPPLDRAALCAALERRLAAAPRLRRQLVTVPLGCGRPLWEDDPAFDIGAHVDVYDGAPPLARAELLDLAAELVLSPLSRNQPLWRATLVPDVGRGRSALVVVLHHVLADGVAGLGLLTDLLAVEPAAEDSGFPRAAPRRRALVVDAVADRVGSLRRLPSTVLRLAAAVAELGPALGASAQRCSLNAPTGPRRRIRTVSASVAELVDLAHRHGATLNDVLLTVVAGALGDLLTARGEQVPQLVVSVPFAARSVARGQLGNHSGVVAVRLPTMGTFSARLASASASTRAAKQHLRGASPVVLAPAFRLMARLGCYRHFINHQRLVHTFVSNVRGPAHTLKLLGRPLVELIPLSVASGNVTVAFTALSYADRLVIAVNADPVTCPDLDRLVSALADQLRDLGVPAQAGLTPLAVGSRGSQPTTPSRATTSTSWSSPETT